MWDKLAVANHEGLIQKAIMVAFVVPHDPRWKMAFEDEAKAIKHAFANAPVDVHHIGSTAIPGILAKPIIDLLGIVATLADADAKASALESLGFEAMGAYGIAGRRYFRKTDSNGIRTHHLHVFEQGSQHVERHFAFRDYLIAHPAVAQEYSSLKERLTQSDAPTWDAYLDGKDPFISRVEPQAVDWYRKLNR
ncbi:GrpB family protein [uncultured Roseobacter sp.]|uniref:GrpB family protein n=1 Tax=uncultured Roseobacter sp. TaxID=114847 RepID=UPI00262728C9|nr:GrpB family protein [uncultured Roseobacter sp.]